MTCAAEYPSYERLIASICWKMTSDRGEIEELMQEGGIAYMKAVEGFDPQRGVKFSTYLYTVVKNELVAYREGQRYHARNTVSIDGPLSEDGGTLHDLLPSQAKPVESRIIEQETADQLIAKISSDTLLVLTQIVNPCAEMTNELRRVIAFRDRSKALGYAAPKIKLSPGFVMDALAFKASRRRKVIRELRDIQDGMV